MVSSVKKSLFSGMLKGLRVTAFSDSCSKSPYTKAIQLKYAPSKGGVEIGVGTGLTRSICIWAETS